MNITDIVGDQALFYKISFTVLALIGYFVLVYISSRRIFRRTLLFHFEESRASYIKSLIRAFLIVALIVLLIIIWEISLKGLGVYLASFLAIAGVGLFATWSVLSNITSSVILFFFFPFRIGSRVRILDGDNSIEGVVTGISLFSIKIQNDEGLEVYCPNSYAIQKTIIHLVDKKLPS